MHLRKKLGVVLVMTKFYLPENRSLEDMESFTIGPKIVKS